ncbi:CRISPR-associated RAMP protein Csm5 family [Methanobrevibacter ruminantium M1]|uniref:CRISPR system Cms protein Csm5 n=1 Tax=Methanobrevibacter ruminantium (strain ATCC 35063 / DSM 1093 / JCM 13430 / OCM 146 / M1) TaxID=634498 RepID=D3E3B8_METRM|nr:type III-A CRISPR-associated RAMP protein Csm5 [Methanobrevibacter ruminantium]ADC47029.1 CRISPR-associated RAMP protein Csm5 family [Methanobrevibacter ruminantium M1]
MMVRLQLETISPVYIGNTGNEYSRSEFAFAKFSGKKKLVRLNLDLVAKELYQRDEKLFKEFLKVLSDTKSFKNIKTKKDNSQFNKNERIAIKGMQKFLYDTIRPYDKDLFKKILSSCSSYKVSLQYAPESIKEKNGKKVSVTRKGESTADIGLIKENLKTNNEPYISGSSIKGAVRNALLYSRLNLSSKSNRDVAREINNKNNRDIKNIMTYVQFSDTFNTIEEPSLYGVESIGTKRNTFSFFETIDRGNVFEFEYRNTFNSKVHNPRMLNNFDLSVESIFKHIYEFSNDILDEEIRFIEDTVNFDYVYSDVDSGKLYKYFDDLKDKNTEESPLLRLGQGSGALGVSQLLEVKNSRSPTEFTTFRKFNRLGHKNHYDFPKTRKLIVNSFEPLGWVKLSKI